MILFLILLGWYLVGLTGSYILFITSVLDRAYLRKEANFCPTRFNVIAILLGALFGPVGLIASIICFFITASDSRIDHPFFVWLNTPICKKESE